MSFPVLKMGSRGEPVQRWQKFLLAQGINLDPESRALDGIFGAGTNAGTREYQSKKDLTPSGVVDSETYNQALKDRFEDGFIG
jgi:peptidoglycan hydrolase-like protein with peptidoglycan-binding domain